MEVLTPFKYSLVAATPLLVLLLAKSLLLLELVSEANCTALTPPSSATKSCLKVTARVAASVEVLAPTDSVFAKTVGPSTIVSRRPMLTTAPDVLETVTRPVATVTTVSATPATALVLPMPLVSLFLLLKNLKERALNKAQALASILEISASSPLLPSSWVLLLLLLDYALEPRLDLLPPLSLLPKSPMLRFKLPPLKNQLKLILKFKSKTNTLEMHASHKDPY